MHEDRIVIGRVLAEPRQQARAISIASASRSQRMHTDIRREFRRASGRIETQELSLMPEPRQLGGDCAQTGRRAAMLRIQRGDDTQEFLASTEAGSAAVSRALVSATAIAIVIDR